MKLRLILAGVAALVVLMLAGLYAVLPFKLFRINGEWFPRARPVDARAVRHPRTLVARAPGRRDGD